MKYSTYLISFLLAPFQGSTTLAQGAKRLRTVGGGSQRYSKDDVSLVPPDVGAEPRRLQSNCDCIDPDKFYYTADFLISTFYNNACTEEDMVGVVAYIDEKFAEYSAFNQVLGPLDIHQYGDSCNVQLVDDSYSATLYGGFGRRLQQEVDDSHMAKLSSAEARTNTVSATDGRGMATTPGRGLATTGTFHYTNGAECRYCPNDEFDARRELLGEHLASHHWLDGLQEEESRQPEEDIHRLTQTTSEVQEVTIQIFLDNKPWHTSYLIREGVDGPVVHAKGGFNTPLNSKQEIVRLTKGQQYTFTLNDSFGDGFNGDSFVLLFFGGLQFRVPFARIQGNFGYQDSISFIATGEADAAATPETPEDLFPALELDMSEYIYYHLRSHFHTNVTHCLHWRNPSIWVDLTRSTKPEAENLCGGDSNTPEGPVPAPPVPAPPVPAPPVPAPAAVTPSPPANENPSPGSSWESWTVSTAKRCGISEVDARGNCRKTCNKSQDCDPGQTCHSVFQNYCGSKPQPNECTGTAAAGHFCGVSELVARETCGAPCTHNIHCAADERCNAVQLNFCNCDSGRMLGGEETKKRHE